MTARRVVVIGQGYVGLPLALAALDAGYRTVGFDVSASRIASLRRGTSYVKDVADEQIAAALHAGYLPTDDAAHLEGFDIAVISVPTPLTDGRPDLSHVAQAGRTLAPFLRRGATVILESTTYPGTTTELLAPILEAGSGLRAGPDFHLGYSPERIDPGNREWDLRRTPKVISGIDDASRIAVRAFFDDLVERTVEVSSTAAAELVKLLENTFRHVNIALVNELAVVARDLGVDIWEVIDAASTKPFGYMRFTPGPGVGGHCLPIDPSYLSWQVKQRTGRDVRFVELANQINASMPVYVVARAEEILAAAGIEVAHASVLLLGLAYKAGTSDWRESPSVAVATELALRGAAVSMCDPHVPAVNLTDAATHMVPFSPAELARHDLVVVLVDHAEFDPATVARHAVRVLDTKNHLRGVDFPGEAL